jgi:hypothetical protein
LPPDTPRTSTQSEESKASSFQKVYSLDTYLMSYTEFRFTLGRIQAGLAKINGEEATLQSRELLIIGAEGEERGAVAICVGI